MTLPPTRQTVLDLPAPSFASTSTIVEALDAAQKGDLGSALLLDAWANACGPGTSDDGRKLSMIVVAWHRVTKENTRATCACCGEPWPCSDSQRTDIIPAIRAAHSADSEANDDEKAFDRWNAKRNQG